MQVLGAGDVDHHPIGRIHRHDGRDALQEPQTQPLQRLQIGAQIGRLDAQIRDQRLRLAHRHPDAQTQTNGRLAGCGHHPAVADAAR